jgi:NADPH:quinone reductase-like Zn-dependent oxidoreductase
MKAAVLVKNTTPDKAFEIREVPKPSPAEGQVLIKVEGFGLNFADVMARQGNYQDCPPLPAVVGYDVVGVVDQVGQGVENVKLGDRVTAMTRFGAYAEYALTDHRACAKISDDYELGKATALTTQYCTAYYCFEEMANVFEGEYVLIHAAAGGVGTALVQLAKHKGCKIFGTAGSDSKLEYLKELGVDYPINYNKEDFVEAVKKVVGDKGVDAIFDAVGGDYVKKDLKILGSGGRLVLFGAATMTGANIFQKVNAGLGFGFYHPAEFMMTSRSMMGVNMLRIADNRPEVLKRCLENVVKLTEQGILDPTVGKVFPVSELAAAHEYLESRKSMGKITVVWE